MGIEFKQGHFEDAKLIREKVFMDEQGFQNEFDQIDQDPHMIHVVAYDAGKPIGCARVFPIQLEPGLENVDGAWVFGRLAVLPDHRGRGLGSQLLAYSEAAAKEHGATTMHLHAQCVAQPFYEKSGYKAYGPIEFDEHVEHQWMEKQL